LELNKGSIHAYVGFSCMSSGTGNMSPICMYAWSSCAYTMQYNRCQFMIVLFLRKIIIGVVYLLWSLLKW